MPLARIVTWLAEDTDALAKDLRARGFEVVTKSPDEISSEPADLEITVDECASEDALTSASGIALAQDKCVFIAPGAIVESSRPVPAISPPVMIREPEPELAYDSVQSPESDDLEPLVAIHQLEDQQETQRQIPVLESAESVVEAVPVVDLGAPVAEPEVSELALEAVSDPLIAAPLAQELTEPLAEVTEPLAEAGEEDLVAQELSASVEYLPPPIIEPVDEVTLAAAEIDSEEHSKTQPDALLEVPAFAQVEAVSPIETEATSQSQLETVVEAAPVPHVEEVWLVETEAVLEAQPEAIVDISAEAPAILQAEVSLTETEPTSDWPIWHPLAEAEIPVQDALVAESLIKEPVFAVPLTSRVKAVFKEQLPQVVPLMQNAVPARPNTYRQRILQKRVLQNDEAFWKTATILAMVAVAALLVGVSANRFSPLPADLAQRSIEAQQPVPFEKARIVPTLPLEAGNKSAAELPAAHGSDGARFRTALAVELATPRTVPQAATGRTVRPRPRLDSAGQPESDLVAEDTVVRYNRKHPPASHTQAQKNSGVKQYSDLD